MLIYGSAHTDESTYDEVLDWLNGVNLPDQHGFKQEFKQLVQRAKDL